MGRAEVRLDRQVGDGATRRQELQERARALRSVPRLRFLQLYGRALSTPSRALILALLKDFRRLTATEIEVSTGLTQGAVSQHMELLEDVGLVKSEKWHKWTVYTLLPGAEGLLRE